MNFRNATLADLPFIVEVYNATIPSRMVTADLEPVTVESKRDWFNKHTTDKRPLWIIEDFGERIGWMSFNSFYGRPAYDSTCEVSLYIIEEARGKGYGMRSLQYAIDACGSLGVKTLLGFIFDHNTPSIRLFSAFGFERWGDLKNVAQLDGVERSLVIVGKRVIP